MKPRLFIGSSSEKLDPAYSVQTNLEKDAEVTVWTQGIFALNEDTLTSLLNALDSFDFGVFIFSPDDLTEIRNNKFITIRDNVVFELGLFLGRLGRKRVFFIVPEGCTRLHLPSDLLGLTYPTYDATRKNLEAALGSACHKIRQVLREWKPPEVAAPSNPQLVHIVNPRILVLGTASFEKDVFEEDVRVLTTHFGPSVRVERNVTGEGARRILTEEQFDIIHISSQIDPGLGDIIFDDEGKDTIPPQGLASLLQVAKTKIVVLASCNSVRLAALLAHQTSMIAGIDTIGTRDFLQWAEVFYRMLSQGYPLSQAFETARNTTKPPMTLIMREDMSLRFQ